MLFRDFAWWLMEVFESENSSIGSYPYSNMRRDIDYLYNMLY